MWFIKWNSYFCKNVGHNNTSITVGEWGTSLRRVFGLKNATSRGPHSTLSISNNRLLENICSTVDVQHFIAQLWRRLPNSNNCEMRGVAFCKRAKEFCFITCLHFYFTFVIIIKQSQWPTESFQVCEFWIHRLRDRLNYQSIKIMIIRGHRKSSQISKFWVRATRKIHPEQLIQNQLFFDHKIKKI